MENAPRRVRDRALNLLGTEFITIDEEIERLAARFIQEGVVAAPHQNDALHVAAATCRRADALVSWNFDHLVSLTKAKRFGNVAYTEGYHPIPIVTPLEVIEG